MEKNPYIWYFYFKMSFLLWRKNYYWAHTSNISTKICYLIGGLDHRADLLLHLHLRHFGRRIPIFYRDSRENIFFKFYGKICDIFCYFCRYLPTFLSYLKKLKSMPRILLEKFERAFFTHFKMWKKTTTQLYMLKDMRFWILHYKM